MRGMASVTKEDRLEQVAREYLARGYEVVVEPGREQLPEFLASFRPDALAVGEKESVVIEVKSRLALSRSSDLARMAEAVQRQPGWRLELVTTEEEAPAEGAETLSREDLARSLEESRELVNSNHSEAAFLFAWSAAEATLRLLAAREHIEPRRTDAVYLLKQLATQAVISRKEYEFLLGAMRVRNAIAHGFKTEEFDPEQVPELVATIDRLLDSVPEAA